MLYLLKNTNTQRKGQFKKENHMQDNLVNYVYGQDSVSDDVEISNKIILLNINTSTFEIEDLFMSDQARKRIIAQLHMKSHDQLYKLLNSLPIVSDKVISDKDKLNVSETYRQ
jgi:hypothetical protein